MKTSIWRRLFDLIAPRTCAVCGERLTITEDALCTVCYMHLPRTKFHLTPLDNAMAHLFWGLLPVERVAALFFYEPGSETARLIHNLKYNNRPDIGTDLGRMMAQEPGMDGFLSDIDVLLPVPLTRRRRWQRGYNQSEEIARGISQCTGIPVCTHAVRRTKFTKSQTQLNFHERRKNVDHLFVLRDARPLQGRHVLLIDDVCTTGSTLIACGSTVATLPNTRISILTLGFTHS